MRVKTEAKREAILEVATKTFAELGYEGTSMSELARRIGGSKGTLYNYFCSKEALFVHIVLRVVANQVAPALEALVDRAHDDPFTVLREFGQKLLTAVTQPDPIAALRMVVSQRKLEGFGRQFFELGPKMGLEGLARYLSEATKAQRLNVSNPQAAAQQLQALFEAETNWRVLLGFDTQFTNEEISTFVERALTVFIAAYGVH